MPYFFLSYARTPRQDPSDPSDPDRWVHKLYRDLCEHILNLTNAQPGSAGFMDRETRPGDEWPRELAQALATCRVFVPLYSPRYFESRNCGKEWFAFARRSLNQRARTPHITAPIVPALWVMMSEDDLPDVARDIQFSHQDLGARYGTDGFYGIMKVNRYRNDYQLAVLRLAQRIVAVAEQTRIGAERPADYMSLENAFGFHGADRGSRQFQIRLTVVAPSTPNLPEGRGPYHYGPTPQEWRPYRPEISQPIADYAAGLATCLGCRPTVGALGEGPGADNEAAGPGVPGLFLIDAWATQSPGHQEQLRRIDELDQPWTGVLLPWNRLDPETAAAEESLREGLARYLSRKLASTPRRWQAAANGVPTLEEFGELFAPMAMTMLRRYLRHAPAYPPDDGSPAERPRLMAPDADDPGEPTDEP